ncbi:MAG: biopolymer transporter ExbD [candidate division WOR-3 bacterium]|nr:biopolymer transporter ExbD [candidate division WOR-3 bacterium]MCX7947809.1 biopolymer transporter ExbD [candidate division WOR-3 bacterium]MDW8150766.1 biopolymer transporter ExbD [candidate division WOR-3 bacterium]
MAKAKGGEGEVAQAVFNLANIFAFIFITLIIASKQMFQSTSVEVEVPKARVIEADLEQSLAVSIKKDKTVYLKDKQVSLQELVQLIKSAQEEYKAKNPDAELGEQLVVIRADKSVDWQTVLNTIDAVKRGGSKRITLAVVKKT